MAVTLVHVGRDLHHAPHHRTFPHTLRVEESVWNDAAWTKPGPSLFLFFCAQPVLRRAVRTNCREQDAKMLDRTIPHEPLGHFLPAGALQLHREPSSCDGGRENIRGGFGNSRRQGETLNSLIYRIYRSLRRRSCKMLTLHSAAVEETGEADNVR